MAPIQNPWYTKTPEIRNYLRLSHGDSDDEIRDLIGAACADLALCGIVPAKLYDTDDQLIQRAIVLYVKAEFGLDNPDSEKYRNSYDLLKTHLMLSNEYIIESDE